MSKAKSYLTRFIFVVGIVALAAVLFSDKIEDYLIYGSSNYGVLTDSRDGQKYRTRVIDGVVWMAENIRYKTKNSWCVNCERYGRLYTWDDAVSVCPDGWMLPTADLWKNLFKAVGSADRAGMYLKSAYKWENDSKALNSVGFSALPAGFYSIKDDAVKNQGSYARWWTYTVESLEKAYRVRMDAGSVNAMLDPIASGYGLSVRCVSVDQKKVRWLEGPQLLNSREEEHASGKLETFTETGLPVIRKQKARRADTLEIEHVDSIVPVLFRGANVNYTRLYERSFVKEKNGVWDTLMYWVYDSLIVSGKLDAFDKDSIDENVCDVSFDGLMVNDERVKIKINESCANVYIGMPYKIDLTFLYRRGGEDVCAGCPQIILEYKDVQVKLKEGDDKILDSRDGTIYPLVKIGKQVWFAKNLHYRNENAANVVCYDYNSSCEEEGYLYDFASAKEACPAGFRLPTNSEWIVLTQTLGSNAGVKMKTSAYWQDGYEGDNSSGFSALPAGYFQNGEEKKFFLAGEYAGWWSSTKESAEKVFVQNVIRSQPVGLSGENKTDGYSVRCIRDK